MACPKVTWHVPSHLDDGIIIEDSNGEVRIIPDLNIIPRQSTPGAMAYDFVSPYDIVVPAATRGPAGDNCVTIGKVIVDTLVAVTLPPGYAMILGSRSGLAAKKHITVEAGWIDNDYRGKIGVVLYNHGPEDYVIEQGERIAQGMIVPVIQPKSISVEYSYPDTSSTERGAGGFGSTGKR